jgi:competence protein ComGC
MEELIVLSIISIIFLVLFIFDIASKKEMRMYPRLWLALFILMLAIIAAYAVNHPESVREFKSLFF